MQQYVPPIDLEALLEGVTLAGLRGVFEDLIKRKEESFDKVRGKFGVIRREKISLETRILDVLHYAREHKRFSFRQMIRRKKNKMDIVVSFLAILELMKMGRVTLVQEQPFGDMDIQSAEDEDAAEEKIDMKDLEDL